MQGKKILIIDDDYHICHIIETSVVKEGAQVTIAQDGHEGLSRFYEVQPDLVILDIMMPEMDGWAVCRLIRQSSDIPIIMLTALHSEDDIVRGLDYGAIDYVTKPFSVKVLLARVRAAMRQSNTNIVEAAPPSTFSDGNLTIDLEKRRVMLKDKPIKLSITEYRLLTYLFKNEGKILTFQEILETVWGQKHRENPDYVRVYVWHLRKKLESEPKEPDYILTEYGIGYRFAEDLLKPVNIGNTRRH
ncbi:MAG: response regulator transcription factor [Anaerolineales bacterium]|nr:response regulator transcription factor [Anaerolineales bacterium]